ncbi:MAG: hypothetical protein HQ477_01925 [Chloroflexi bacterium]|mgnify:CR=1 FL=1|jgi:hypothetical protein|nr:hypothetical protein [Chloroflexota bacterium]
MSVRTSRKVFSSTLSGDSGQRGVSGVTVAVVLAACAVVALTIVQAVTSGGTSAAQNGIPGLIG